MRFINGNIITECKRVTGVDECDGCYYDNKYPSDDKTMDEPCGVSPCLSCVDNGRWEFVRQLDLRDCERMAWMASHGDQIKQVIEAWNSAVLHLRDEIDTAMERIK